MFVLFLCYLVTLICFPQESIQTAGTGLQVWFQRLIPTLFPFMVVSTVMIQTGFVRRILKPFRYILFHKLHMNESALFCILIGMIAGFPMGAKNVSECYKKGELTLQEAEWLLSFCNVIGPMYLFGYLLPTLHLRYTFPVWIGAYGISLFYGFILRCTVYKNIFQEYHNYTVSKPNVKPLSICLEDAISNCAETILLLGGNIVFFSVWLVIPTGFCEKWSRFLAPLIEISSGLDSLGSDCPIYSLLAISFGGVCCIMQTKCCFQGTPLSLKKYVMHKCNLVVLTSLYYFLLRNRL